MKKITFFLLCAVMGIGAMWAQTDVAGPGSKKVSLKIEELVTIDGSQYVLVNNEYADLYMAKDVSGTFAVPASVNYGGKSYPVKNIRGMAFMESGATSVSTSGTLEGVWSNAFTDARALQSVSLAEGVKMIEEGAFDSKTLQDIFVIDSNKYFAAVKGVLYNKEMTRLHSYPAGKRGASFTVPSTVQTIGKKAFSSCQLTSVTLPSSVKVIEEGAFEYCNNLESFAFGPNVTQIDAAVFSNCNSLSSVSIPASLTKIGVSAFGGCTALTAFTVASANPVFSAINGVLFSKDKKKLLVCPSGISGTYAIPEGTVEIGHSAFDSCEKIENITFAKSVTKLDSLCFYDCKFRSIVIPNTIKEIPYGCFLFCNSMRDVTFSESLTTIGERAFEGCFALQDLTVPDKVVSIGKWAFSGCTGLRDITLGKSLTSIGNNAFIGANPRRIYCRSRIPCALDYQSFDFSYFFDSCDVYVPRGCADAYQNASGWEVFFNIYEYDVVFKGDVNGDSEVDITDVNILLNIVLGKDSASKYGGRADVDGNGIIDITDVNTALNLVLGK